MVLERFHLLVAPLVRTCALLVFPALAVLRTNSPGCGTPVCRVTQALQAVHTRNILKPTLLILATQKLLLEVHCKACVRSPEQLGTHSTQTIQATMSGSFCMKVGMKYRREAISGAESPKHASTASKRADGLRLPGATDSIARIIVI
jgi:hypothetical protein